MSCSLCGVNGLGSDTCPLNPDAEHIEHGHQIKSGEEEPDIGDMLEKIAHLETKIREQEEELEECMKNHISTGEQLSLAILERNVYFDQSGYLSRTLKTERRERLNREKTLSNLTRRLQNFKIESCSICLSEIVTGDRLSITRCGHVFHADCLSESLKSSFLCPLCRTIT